MAAAPGRPVVPSMRSREHEVGGVLEGQHIPSPVIPTHGVPMYHPL